MKESENFNSKEFSNKYHVKCENCGKSMEIVPFDTTQEAIGYFCFCENKISIFPKTN